MQLHQNGNIRTAFYILHILQVILRFGWEEMIYKQNACGDGWRQAKELNFRPGTVVNQIILVIRIVCRSMYSIVATGLMIRVEMFHVTIMHFANSFDSNSLLSQMRIPSSSHNNSEIPTGLSWECSSVS